MTLHVTNWSQYQSYKDRKPPWIRFHRSMIDNYEYQMMSPESRALLPMLWLLACEDKDPSSGRIDLESKVIAYRLRRDEQIITECIAELERCGFIGCDGIVTESLPNRTKTVTPETETETERDSVISSPKVYSDSFQEFWLGYPPNRRGNKSRAYIEWKNIESSEHGKITSIVKQRKNTDPDWIKDNGKFICHAERYLKGCRWEETWKAVNTTKTVSELRQEGRL